MGQHQKQQTASKTTNTKRQTNKVHNELQLVSTYKYQAYAV